jgi:hypothetical protein
MARQVARPILPRPINVRLAMPIRPFLLLFVALLSVPASEPAGGTDLPAAWFVDAALAIQDGRAPVAQAKDWQQRLAKASAGDRTLLFTLLAAWRRTYPGRPDWALTGLAPLLSGRAAPTSDAAPPLGPDGKPRPWADLLGANGPAAWRIERPLVMLHAELGRSLAALGEIEALVALVDRWREASGQDRLVQAAMATALGLISSPRSWRGSTVRFFISARKCFHQLMKAFMA